MNTRSRALALAATVSLATATTTSANYTLTDLGTFYDVGFAGSGATAINNNGDVVGYSSISATEVRPFLWTSSSGMQDLGTLGFAKGYAAGINNLRQVVGYTSDTATTPTMLSSSTSTAFVWSNSTGMQALPKFTNIGTSVPYQARAINDSGLITGYGRDVAGNQTVITWDTANGNAATSLLGHLGISKYITISAFGLSINNNGTILIETDSILPGRIISPGWDGGTLTPSSGTYINNNISDGSRNIYPRFISSSGLITGYFSQDLTWVGFIANSQGQMTPLPVDDYPYVTPYGINSSGVVVGVRSKGAGNEPFIYLDGAMHNPNNLIDSAGWTITELTAINDAGQIVGAAKNSQNKTHAILLNISVPEPTTLTLLAAPALLLLKRRRS